MADSRSVVPPPKGAMTIYVPPGSRKNGGPRRPPEIIIEDATVVGEHTPPEPEVEPPKKKETPPHSRAPWIVGGIVAGVMLAFGMLGVIGNRSPPRVPTGEQVARVPAPTQQQTPPLDCPGIPESLTVTPAGRVLKTNSCQLRVDVIDGCVNYLNRQGVVVKNNICAGVPDDNKPTRLGIYTAQAVTQTAVVQRTLCPPYTPGMVLDACL